MQCKCCGTEISGSASMCPACGFPTLVHGDLDIEKEAKAYRDKMIGQISLYIKSYTYTYDKEQDTFGQSEEFLPIAELATLVPNEIKWADKEFIDVSPDRSIKLSFRIKTEDTKHEREIVINAGEALCRSRVGVILGEGFRLRIAVGSPEKYIMSDPISLINN